MEEAPKELNVKAYSMTLKEEEILSQCVMTWQNG